MSRYFFKHKNCPSGRKPASFAVEVTHGQRRSWEGWDQVRKREYSNAVGAADRVICPHCGAVPRDRYRDPWSKIPGTYVPQLMGRVEGKRLVADSLQAPCDGRCTNARGPSCDCPCNGANHGTQRLIKVSVDAGSIPEPGAFHMSQTDLVREDV